MDRALASLTSDTGLYWQDSIKGQRKAQPATFGDVVLARKEIPTSYHLSVTVDDHFQGVTDVIRGDDLYHATDVHVLLQALLAMRTPAYHHHALICGPDGKRFSKRDGAVTLRELRNAGKIPADIRAMVGLT
jgi:glutamyl-Q tRNA(Asp) synthetase